MYTYKSKKLPKHTTEFAVEVEWSAVAQKKEKVFNALAENVSVPGFRKGKAPREQAARYIAPEKLYDRVVRELIPDIYREIVEKEKLKPVTSPAIELIKAKENEKWELTIQVAEVPEVKLKDYKKKLALQNKAKKDAKVEGAPPDDEATQQLTLDGIFKALLAEIEIEIPELLVREEVDRRLSQLVDDVRRVGLTLDGYLSSKKQTEEELRASLARDAQDMYRIEFALAKIAESEGIRVEQTDLDVITAQAKTEAEKAAAARNLAWYESLLRKQKVLDFLNNL